MSMFLSDCHASLIGCMANPHYKGLADYVYKRGLTIQSIYEHKIGFCDRRYDIPMQVRHMDEREPEKDFSGNILGKIIVPVLGEFDETVGFATRSYEPDGTSWWNSVFPKTQHLFLLNKARDYILEEDKIYVVEGQMDAIILYQYGIKNVVSMMGTNLSLRHISYFARYCSNICFCFDFDKNNSGQKALRKAAVAVNGFRIFDDISYVDLPIGIDPDDYVIKYGKDAFLKNEKHISPKDIAMFVKEIKNDKKK